MIITEVKVQTKNKLRSNIYLDGKYYCSLDNLVVVKNGLKAGIEIEQEQLNKIQEESEFNIAFDCALNYITRYKKSKKQITDYLMKKGYVFPVAFKVVEKLSGYGLADDRDYAKSYVEQASKDKGKYYIKMQLRARGIDEKCADEAIDEIGDESEACKGVAQKYMKNKECDRETLAKCYRYLLSKGFSYDAVNSAISFLKGNDYDD